jgi:hypothetical protein
MTPLSLAHVTHLDELLRSGADRSVAFARAIGGTAAGAGFWRFFSESWPEGGISGWNAGSSWKSHWRAVLPAGFLSFGEDVFGNQLVLANGCASALLWNHENGECDDLLVGPCELLQTVLESGLDWIDFYTDGSLGIARQYGPVPLDVHLHWTTPLILGGRVSRDNVSVVKRERHLVSHAMIWAQVSVLPPGTRVVPR